MGLLPLHALFNTAPYGLSPYYPSSRLFLNPIYVAVDQVPEASAPEVCAFLEADETRREIRRLRDAELVDYEGVWALKRQALALCYRAFRARQGTGYKSAAERGFAFETWRRKQGQHLEKFAAFSALRDDLASASAPRPWQEWPEGLRAADSPQVDSFRQDRPEDVGFYAYLQWLAEGQLSRASEQAKGAGMAVGLYLDLALGADPCGAEAWVYQDVLALDASAGAPPDPFSLLGQRWGVPPPIPERHREGGYDFFLEILRHNAHRCSALRIDHVLALWRLFWVPGDLPASCGAYVAEHAGELLGLLRLVSREEQCLVVGEDLGTIPPEVREALMASGFYSYRLLIFEKEDDGRYRLPADYPRQALVSVATHDLPTLDGFWVGRDLEVKRDLYRYPDPEAEQNDAEGRRWDRLRLLEAMAAEQLLPTGIEPNHEVSPERLDDLAEAVHGYLARTPSALMLANLDDLLGGFEMQNLPGTIDEHPNWRRKCPVPLEDWGKSTRAARIAAAIRREGRGS
jgi:4-alpha-glucanotransferase